MLKTNVFVHSGPFQPWSYPRFYPPDHTCKYYICLSAGDKQFILFGSICKCKEFFCYDGTWSFWDCLLQFCVHVDPPKYNTVWDGLGIFEEVVLYEDRELKIGALQLLVLLVSKFCYNFFLCHWKFMTFCGKAIQFSLRFACKTRGQCYKTFYCGNLPPFHGIPSFCVIKHYYYGKYHRMAVNYRGKKVL